MNGAINMNIDNEMIIVHNMVNNGDVDDNDDDKMNGKWSKKFKS